MFAHAAPPASVPVAAPQPAASKRFSPPSVLVQVRELLHHTFSGSAVLLAQATGVGALLGLAGAIGEQVMGTHDPLTALLRGPRALELFPHLGTFDRTMVIPLARLLELVEQFVPSQLAPLLQLGATLDGMAVCAQAALAAPLEFGHVDWLAWQLADRAERLVDDITSHFPPRARFSDEAVERLQELYDIKNELQGITRSTLGCASL